VSLHSSLLYSLNLGSHIARGKQEKLCEEAIQQLQSAGKDLHTLEDQVGKMVNWWFDLDTQFNHISKNMEDIRINASLRERMKKLAREFEKFQIQLQDYMHSVSRKIIYLPFLC
jgi:hypothetical protein